MTTVVGVDATAAGAVGEEVGGVAPGDVAVDCSVARAALAGCVPMSLARIRLPNHDSMLCQNDSAADSKDDNCDGIADPEAVPEAAAVLESDWIAGGAGAVGESVPTANEAGAWYGFKAKATRYARESIERSEVVQSCAESTNGSLMPKSVV